MSDGVPTGAWPATDLQRVPVCPACRSSERSLLHDGVRDWVFKCAPGEWTLWRCKSCRAAYLDPVPSPQSIGAAYLTYYTHVSGMPAHRGLRGLVRRAENAYRRWEYSRARNVNDLIRALPVMFSPARRDRMQWSMRHLPRPPGRLFDLGCGNGDFLTLARSVGWDCTGADFDEAAVAAARKQGHVVYHSGAEALAGFRDHFDLITLSHVIEHVYDPADVLAACFQALKPEGRIWIDTPNIDATGARLFKRYWRGLEAPRHLVLFNHDSLSGLLANAGFSDVRDAPYRPLADWMFTASSAIAAAAGSAPVPFDIKQVERDARRDPMVRELLCLTASKPRN